MVVAVLLTSELTTMQRRVGDGSLDGWALVWLLGVDIGCSLQSD